MKTFTLIPARIGSKGVPNKNFKALAGVSCVKRAIDCARAAQIEQIVVSSDRVSAIDLADSTDDPCELIAGVHWLGAYAPLHTDGCQMIEIVRDALARVPGRRDDVWVLLQPSSPLRTPSQVTTAIDLLKFTKADSVVTVKRSASCDALLLMGADGMLRGATRPIYATPQRQLQQEYYLREGTAYVFWRRTVDDYGNIYGPECRAMILAPGQSLSIDTPEDWTEAERRIKQRDEMAMRDSPGRGVQEALSTPPASPAASAKCDGNHGGPRCADPECWNDMEAASPRLSAATPAIEQLQKYLDKGDAAGGYSATPALTRAIREVVRLSAAERPAPTQVETALLARMALLREIAALPDYAQIALFTRIGDGELAEASAILAEHHEPTAPRSVVASEEKK